MSNRVTGKPTLEQIVHINEDVTSLIQKRLTSVDQKGGIYNALEEMALAKIAGRSINTQAYYTDKAMMGMLAEQINQAGQLGNMQSFAIAKELQSAIYNTIDQLLGPDPQQSQSQAR